MTALEDRPRTRDHDPARGRTVEQAVLRTAVRVAHELAGNGAPDFVDPIEWARGAASFEAALGRILLRAAIIGDGTTTRHARAPSHGVGAIAPAPAPSSFRPSAPSAPSAPPRPPPALAPAPAPAPAPLSYTPVATGPPRQPKPVSEPEELPTRRRRRARGAAWVRNVGVIALLFVAYQLWGTGLEQARHQADLARDFRAALAAAPAPPAASNASAGTAPAPVADAPALLPGGVIARLQIPKLDLDQYVVEGTGTDDLQKGPGHYAGSSLPGHAGNVAIAGHRTTYGAPFNRLDELDVNDQILLTTTEGTFAYVVTEAPFPVSPSKVSVVNDQGDDRLTLTTCHPKYSASKRLIVTAALQGPVSATAAPRAPTAGPVAVPVSTATERAASEPSPVVSGERSGFHAGALPATLLWVCVLVALGLAYRPLRRLWPPLPTLLVVVPIWTCSLLMLFEQLNHFLPPDV